jgi:D-alanyl-D-alanine carboxypeptidase
VRGERLLKKIVKTVSLIIIGIIVIFGINRFVTRKVVIEDADSSVIASEKEATQKKEKEQETKQDILPDGSIDDWNLILVGPKHPLEKDIPQDNLVEIPGSVMQLDRRVIEPYQQLTQAAEQAGYPLALVSSYRSVSYQEQVFNDAVYQYMSQGLSEKEAITETKKTSTEPGNSEHHTGLAIDVVDTDWQQNYPRVLLEPAYGDEPGAKWLAEHAREYGFIVRYPEGKEDITKITYEPWHFRYVGVEHAKYIEENHLTLEEYIDLLKEK